MNPAGGPGGKPPPAPIRRSEAGSRVGEDPVACRDQGREERPRNDRRDLEAFEEAGELPARPPEGRPVRYLSLHVPAAGAGCVPPGSRADPGVGDVRPLHSSPGDAAERLAWRGGVPLRRPSDQRSDASPFVLLLNLRVRFPDTSSVGLTSSLQGRNRSIVAIRRQPTVPGGGFGRRRRVCSGTTTS